MLTSVHDFDLSEQRINLQTENPPSRRPMFSAQRRGGKFRRTESNGNADGEGAVLLHQDNLRAESAMTALLLQR